MKQLDRINRFVNKYLTVFVLLIVAVALVLPGPMSVPGRISFGTLHLAGRSFSFSLTNVMLMIIMFGAGTAVSPEEIGHLVRKPLTLGIAVIVKYLAMVFAAFAAARILRLGPELAFGMILLGSMPSGTAAAVLVALAGGEVPFGVALCVISTLIAPIASPLLTLLVMRLVFTQFFGNSTAHYTTYLFSGLIVFNYYAEATRGSMKALSANKDIILKIKRAERIVISPVIC